MNASPTHPKSVGGLAPHQLPQQAETDEQLIHLWLHGRPENTRRAYMLDVIKFREHARKPLRAATVGDVQAFGDTLNHLSDATKARRLAAVKSLLSFGHRIGYLPFDVGKPVRTPKLKDDLAERILPEETVLKILALEPNQRNKAIIRVLYSAGLRVSELCALYWRDVRERDDAGQLCVFGKGGKTRYVLLTRGTWEAIAAGREGSGDHLPVFRARKSVRPLSPSQVRRIVYAAAKRAGVDKRVSPHWLRHCHGSHALDRGAAVHLVQATLGHSSVATTGRYLHARPSESSSKYLAV